MVIETGFVDWQGRFEVGQTHVGDYYICKDGSEFAKTVASIILKVGKTAVLNHDYLKCLLGSTWSVGALEAGGGPAGYKPLIFTSGKARAIIMPISMED